MKTRVFENMNDLKNNRLGGHIKNNDISFVKENNSIIIGDNNVRNSILYPPILTTVQIDSESLKFTEDIILQIQQGNNLEEILKYCLIGMGMGGENIVLYTISLFKLTKNIEDKDIVTDYENYYYLRPVVTARKPGDEYYNIIYLEISKQFPYTIKIK